MEITDVRIRRVYEEGKIRAIVSITLDNQFAIHDIKIIEGYDGPFVVMPSRRIGPGRFRDVAHPINKETRTMVEEAIFKAYEIELEELKEAKHTEGEELEEKAEELEVDIEESFEEDDEVEVL